MLRSCSYFNAEAEKAELPVYLPHEPTAFPAGIPQGVYVFDENTFGFTTLRLTVDGGGVLRLMVSDGAQQQTITCGCGMYENSELWAEKLTPKLRGRMRDDRMERVALAAAWYSEAEHTFCADVRFLSSVYPETWKFSFDGTTLLWDFQNPRFRQEDCRTISAKIVTVL